MLSFLVCGVTFITIYDANYEDFNEASSWGRRLNITIVMKMNSERVTDCSFCRSESVQLHMPQPVDPRLSSWPITGLIERLNHFLGNRPPFGGIAVRSPQLVPMGYVAPLYD